MLLLLHSAFMLGVVKMLLKGEVGDHVLNSHGNYVVDHGKSWKNHGNVFLNFCGNPVIRISPQGRGVGRWRAFIVSGAESVGVNVTDTLASLKPRSPRACDRSATSR